MGSDMYNHLKSLIVGVVLAGASAFNHSTLAASAKNPFRPPSVPLVACDPYFSIWSPADKLTDAPTNHWTRAPQRLTSMVRIDDQTYRIMGDEPKDIPALEQRRLIVMPTTTRYVFEGKGVRVSLSFMTPFLPDDLMIFSRPVTYLTWRLNSIDGKEHEVTVYYDNTAELVVNTTSQEVTWASEKIGDLDVMKVGTVEQPVLRRKGDGVRIDWGYLYVAVPQSQLAALAAGQGGKILIAPCDTARQAIEKEVAAAAPTESGKPAKDAPVLSVTFKLDKVAEQPVSRWLILAYDDIYSAQFFHKNLKAYWKKDGAEIADLLKKSAAEYDDLRHRCRQFNRELMADLNEVGGPKYAQLCALAYRQSFAASKVVVDDNGQPLFFCKENTSNGCMGTVDVFYPQSPLPLLVSPSLSKAMLIPVLEYASSPLWKWPNAPHDVGTWPKANGQAYGGAKSDGGMPVEETGNMLLLVAAVAQVEGNVDFAAKYWPTLTKWAEYLKNKGFDPENQLCTDDFAGHLAHNVNLSAKAICALGAFGKLCAMRGDKATAQEYTKIAKEFALRWVKEADDGDHFRLAFDKPGTWSTKYNLVWDKILEMNLFPEDAIKKEMAFYRKNLDKYGLPLDGRKQAAGRNTPNQRMAFWSKTDWAFWTACLTNNQEDFEAIISPIYRFFNEATVRVGLTDLYFTDQPDAALMHSRPVIGGLFIKMLYNKDVWKKWAERDKTKANGPWAPLPTPPKTFVVVPTSEKEPATWRYTTEQPDENWYKPGFNDSSWKEGKAGFGAGDPPGSTIRTRWNTSDIWLRREITLPERKWNEPQLALFHDEDAEVYINGQRAANVSGYVTEYELVPISRRAVEALKPGKNLIAVHCHQTNGGQYIDVGLIDVVEL